MKMIIISYSLWAIPWLLVAQATPPPPVPLHLLPYDTTVVTRYQLAFDSLAETEDTMIEEIIQLIERSETHLVLKKRLIALLGTIDHDKSIMYLIDNLNNTTTVPLLSSTERFDGHYFMHAIKNKKTPFALTYLCDFARTKCLNKQEILLLTTILSSYMNPPLNLDPQWILYAAKGNRGDRNNPCVVKNFDLIIQHLKEIRAFDY